ncbi:uncharacterized protein [Triticum aestivum]|uniref:uncharacterized protein n=1 Tax=Triticum aestivum TaxID=4565 RepID=UPI001ABCC94E|nr:uncharacterized protein LOC109734674 [Aegilops tauschii subsp. strangulata]XP_044416360.1 uncharacterized protein LOC123141225 [Triticum aestivum]
MRSLMLSQQPPPLMLGSSQPPVLTLSPSPLAVPRRPTSPEMRDPAAATMDSAATLTLYQRCRHNRWSSWPATATATPIAPLPMTAGSPSVAPQMSINSIKLVSLPRFYVAISSTNAHETSSHHSIYDLHYLRLRYPANAEKLCLKPLCTATPAHIHVWEAWRRPSPLNPLIAPKAYCRFTCVYTGNALLQSCSPRPPSGHSNQARMIAKIRDAATKTLRRTPFDLLYLSSQKVRCFDSSLSLPRLQL